jgi:hypothetical protein
MNLHCKRSFNEVPKSSGVLTKVLEVPTKFLEVLEVLTKFLKF